MAITELGALRLTDRPAWEGRIRAAIERNQGNRTRAAKDLGVSLRALQRHMAELGAPKGRGGRPAKFA